MPAKVGGFLRVSSLSQPTKGATQIPRTAASASSIRKKRHRRQGQLRHRKTLIDLEGLFDFTGDTSVEEVAPPKNGKRKEYIERPSIDGTYTAYISRICTAINVTHSLCLSFIVKVNRGHRDRTLFDGNRGVVN